MFFIRIIGLLTGIALVVLIALWPGNNQLTDFFKSMPARLASSFTPQAEKTQTNAIHDTVNPNLDQQADSVDPDTQYNPESSAQSLPETDETASATNNQDNETTGTTEAFIPGEHELDNATTGTAEAFMPAHNSALSDGNRHYIWRPFNLKSRAEGFARHMNSLCDVTCEVEKQNKGYLVYFKYQEAAERDRAIECMQDRAGISLTEAAVQQDFIN